MAFFEDILKGNPVTGAIVGIGAVMLAPSVLPAVGRVLRPAAKAVIKGGIVLYRETVAEAGEAVGDLFAEARAELENADGHDKTDRALGEPTERHGRSQTAHTTRSEAH